MSDHTAGVNSLHLCSRLAHRLRDRSNMEAKRPQAPTPAPKLQARSRRRGPQREERSCEEATESAVRDSVLPRGLTKREERISPDVENGLT